MRQHILIVTPEFPPQTGGIGTHSYEMAQQWSRQADVTVIAPAALEPRGQMPFRLIEVGRQRTRVRRLLHTTLAIRRAIRDDSPTVIYSAHWRASGVPVLLAGAAWQRRVRLAQAFHGSEILTLLRASRRGLLPRLLFELTQRRANVLVALGSYPGKILEGLGVTRERIHVCPEGVDLARFTHVDPSIIETLRERLGVGGKRIVLTVARLVERKGHDMVIRALPLVLERVPDAVYVIVGEGPDEARIRALATEVAVADRTVFAGRVSSDELLAAYGLCDVFVMASREVEGDVEGFGIAFIEAAALAKPCVGGRSGGVSDAVSDGVTGFLVDPLNPRAIADAASRLLLDPELARAIGRAGRERVVAEFSYEEIATGLYAAISCGPIPDGRPRRSVKPVVPR